MKTISVVCEKGGTGKTTLSKEIYEGMKRKGKRTSLFSLDGQYDARTEQDPNAEIAVIDTQGSLTAELRKIINNSDIVVVPVRPTPNDMEPFMRTINLIKEIGSDIPLLIVVNGFNRYKMAKGFMQWLESQEWAENVLTIPQSEQVVQAQPGQSAVDLGKTTTAAKAIQAMVDKVIQMVGI